MLKKLDKYIIRKYLSTFFFVVLIISLIACVIDFSDHLDDFNKSKAPLSKIIGQYYFNFVPYINGLLWPLYALLSVIFFTSRLAFNSEIISILNAGVSFGRLMRPYLIAAAILAGMQLYMNSEWIPRGSKAKIEFENTYFYSHNDEGKRRNVHLFLSENSKVFIKNYIKRDSVAVDVMVETFDSTGLRSILSADKMTYLPEGKWRIEKYYTRTFLGLREDIREGKSVDTTFNLLPEDFVNYDNAKDAMTSRELRRYIERQKSRSAGNTEAYEIELHRRWAGPFTIFILTMIGMSLAARKIRGGIGLHLALGVGLGALYILMFQFSTTFVTNAGLPPMLGVWIPTFIFSLVAVVLMFKAQK